MPLIDAVRDVLRTLSAALTRPVGAALGVFAQATRANPATSIAIIAAPRSSRACLRKWQPCLTPTGRRAWHAVIAAGALLLPMRPLVAQQGLFTTYMSNAERQEFALAIEAFHALGWDPLWVTCVTVDYQPEQRRGRAGAEFDWTPWAFSAHLDQKSLRWSPPLSRQLELLQKYGYLDRIGDVNGIPTYGMTWQGFAASNGQGCFRIASDERTVTVHGSAPSPRHDARGVSATAVPVVVEPIASDPEFNVVFETAAKNVQAFDKPAVYGIGRYEGRPIVLASKTHNAPPPPVRSPSHRRAPRLAGSEVARRVGSIDASRMQAFVAERLKNFAPLAHSPISRVCLYFPIAIDETNYFGGERQLGEPLYREPLWFTIYNTERNIHDRDQREAFALFKAFEAAGLVTSRLLPSAQFRDRPAKGAVRFEMTPRGMALMDATDSSCVRIGNFEPETPLRFQQFTPANLTPKFVGRAVFRPSAGTEPLIERLPFLKSLVQIGGAYWGQLNYRYDAVDVDLSFQLVSYRLDVENVRLPEVK